MEHLTQNIPTTGLVWSAEPKIAAEAVAIEMFGRQPRHAFLELLATYLRAMRGWHDPCNNKMRGRGGC